MIDTNLPDLLPRPVNVIGVKIIAIVVSWKNATGVRHYRITCPADTSDPGKFHLEFRSVDRAGEPTWIDVDDEPPFGWVWRTIPAIALAKLALGAAHWSRDDDRLEIDLGTFEAPP